VDIIFKRLGVAGIAPENWDSFLISILSFNLYKKGDLYVALTLPALIVGTVGAGTALPTQKECLEMLKCSGAGNANKFAEICCAVKLAEEISIVAAMAANHFSSAHQKLGRKQ